MGMADERPASFDQVERAGRWISERLTFGAEWATFNGILATARGESSPDRGRRSRIGRSTSSVGRRVVRFSGKWWSKTVPSAASRSRLGV